MAQYWDRQVATLDGDAADQAFAGPADLHFIHVVNDDATTVWVHLFDETNANVTPASDVGTIVFPVLADTQVTVPLNTRFDTGCVACASTTAAAGGSATTAVAFLLSYSGGF